MVMWCNGVNRGLFRARPSHRPDRDCKVSEPDGSQGEALSKRHQGLVGLHLIVEIKGN